VKFHAAESDFLGSEKEQEYDFYHWSAILRSVSAFEVYRKVYRDVIRPERVAELLILRPDMPRSLLGCMNEVMTNLAMVTSSPASESKRRAGKLRADLQFARIDGWSDSPMDPKLDPRRATQEEILRHAIPR
jgi:uncharacterized alpha-E superfamily protein